LLLFVQREYAKRSKDIRRKNQKLSLPLRHMIEILIEYPNGGKTDVYSPVDKSAGDFKRAVAWCEYFALLHASEQQCRQ